MAKEITLKKKVTIRVKQQEILTFERKLKVKLFWSSAGEDLDLCLFFKKKDGSIGGVFSDEYRGKKSDLGSLEKFPYILHLGDKKDPAPGTEECEQINIARLDEIDTAYVCIVNYTAAVDRKDTTFAEVSGRIELQSDSGDYLEVQADSKDEGPVYCVCSIKNDDGKYSVMNESRVLDLSGAYEQIPGFSLILND